MNLFKRTIFALFVSCALVSCEDDAISTPPNESGMGTGLTQITFPNLDVDAGGEDGTIVTVTPQGLGVDYYEVDFGDPNSTDDIVLITEVGGNAIYDYPNELEEVDYTITVTAKSNEGFSDVVLTDDITVEHKVLPIDTAPESPKIQRRNNVYAIFTDGFEYEENLISYAGGENVTVDVESLTIIDSLNAIHRFSRLGAEAGIFSLPEDVVISEAFGVGVGVEDIHFDIHSVFETGIDKLKITLVDNSNNIDYVIDEIDLMDGDWASFDYNLATDFSAPVVQFDEVKFEVATSGLANDHATIFVDNVYMYRPTGSTILNGDFENSQDFWKWGLFTDGDTNPFGSTSDGSDFDIDGNDVGKTRGAKWTASQSGGDFRSSSSRYAYQELALTPGANYILQYQYAIKTDSGSGPIGGRNVVGVVLDGYFIDGAEAVDNNVSNLGEHKGFIAEGKFSNTADGGGTVVQIPFTANDSGEVAVMFYATTPADAFIDNVKIIEL